jgi:hypothetical protein
MKVWVVGRSFVIDRLNEGIFWPVQSRWWVDSVWPSEASANEAADRVRDEAHAMATKPRAIGAPQARKLVAKHERTGPQCACRPQVIEAELHDDKVAL